MSDENFYEDGAVIPEAPSEFTLWLYKNGPVKTIIFFDKHTSEDSWETHVILTASNGNKRTIPVRSLRNELKEGYRTPSDIKVKLEDDSIIQLTKHGLDKCEKWDKYVKNASAEFELYKKLKKKFEGQEKAFDIE